MVRLLALACVVCLAAGCSMFGHGPSKGKEDRGMMLFDATSGTTSRVHCKTVDDPLGVKGKVIRGELVEKDMNKTTLLNDNGFFTMPKDWKGEVVIDVAVVKERKLRVALVVESGALKSYYPEAPTEKAWTKLVLPLKAASAKIQPGEKIVDISIWQLGGGKEAALYVGRATLKE